MSRWTFLAAVLLGAALTACSGGANRADPGTPPDTTAIGPGGAARVSGARDATFQLSGSAGAVAYRCTLDGAPVACTGPMVTVAGLAAGPHVFTAAAVDADGRVDPTPAIWAWTMDPALPPPPTFSATATADQIVVTYTAPPEGGAIVSFGHSAATATEYLVPATGSPMTLTVGFPGPDGQLAPIQPCAEYWVTVAALDAAMHLSDPAPPQRVVTTPAAPAASVFGKDGEIVVGAPAEGAEYQVEYGAAPDRFDGTEALEGASPVVVAAGGSLHGLQADQPRWFRVSRRFGPSCVGAAGPAQRATPRPWRPLNAGPTAAELLTVACSSATSCVAAGAGGVALVTSDGTSWSPTSFSDGTTRQAAASPTALFAHGYDGVLHRSTDGGATWSRRGRIDASSVAFLTADVGVAATQFGVYRSADGGLTWARSHPYAAHAVAAVPGGAAAVAVTLEGAALVSVDAGATWASAASTPEALLAVTCPSATRCLAGGTSGLLLVSDDAGATWAPRATGFTDVLVALAFGDDLRGLAIVSTTDGSRSLHRSVDGGSTWEPVALEPVGAVAAAGPGSALAVGVAGLLVRSDDAGASWTQVGERRPVPGGQAGGAVRLVAPGVVLAAGTAGALRSTDGGATWTAVTYPAEVARATAAAMAFANERFGLMPAVEGATGAQRVLRTLDGGATWSLDGSGVLPAQVTDLACLENAGEPASTTCHAVAGRALYRTLDGGASWHLLSGAGEEVREVRFLDEAHGFLSSGGAFSSGQAATPFHLLATADGGATWAPVAGARAGALAVAPPATVVSGADASYDGGATWERWEPAPAGAAIAVGVGLRVSYEATGFSVAALAPGAPGRSDGAFPWEGPMMDLALVDADRWFGVDLNGVIWTTATGGR